MLLVAAFFTASYYIYQNPTFDKPEIAKEQIEGTPHRNTDGSYRKFAVDEKYTFYLETKPYVDEQKKLYLYLTNVYYSKVYLRVEVFDEEGSKIGQSDLCEPGHYIESVTVSASKKGIPITMKVISYEAESFHSRGNITVKAELAL